MAYNKRTAISLAIQVLLHFYFKAYTPVKTVQQNVTGIIVKKLEVITLQTATTTK